MSEHIKFCSKSLNNAKNKPQKNSRRVFLQSGATLLLSVLVPQLSYASQILAVRVWPADEYTRVTLEGDVELKATQFLVKDPLRMVVDIEGLELNSTLKEIIAKIQPDDPYIKQVRVGQNRPNVVRLVFDLKEEINPQVFTLAPVGEYKYRLVFDLYRMSSPDEFLEAGFRDVFNRATICIVEWPEKGRDVLPLPDLEVHLTVAGKGRHVELRALSDKGSACLNKLNFAPNL